MRADAALPMESSTRIVTSCVVAVHVLPHGKGLPLPRYESAGAAGLDLCAAGFDGERLAEYTLQPGHRVLVNCGIAIAIPVGFEGHIRARSGLALRRGLGLVNGIGTIDADYRGELGAILINWGSVEQTIQRGSRIAQLVISPVVHAGLVMVDELPATARGAGGFGSTGGS